MVNKENNSKSDLNNENREPVKKNNNELESFNQINHDKINFNLPRSLNKDIQNMIQNYQNQFNSIFEILNDASGYLNIHFNKITELMNKSIEYFRDIHERKIILNMANHGWYPNLMMSIPQLASAFNFTKSEKYNLLDDFFLNYFEEEWDSLWLRALKNNPDRSKLLAEAKAMYESNFYSGFICLILTQIDGIANEHLNIEFFSKKDEEMKKKKENFKSNNAFSEIFNSLIIDIHDINEKSTKWDYKSGSLNRHSIQHGGFIEYGTKLNSLKVFSLLCFIEDHKD